MGFLSSIFDKLKNASRQRFIFEKEDKTIQILLDTSHEKYFTLQFDSLVEKDVFDPSIYKSVVLNATSQALGQVYIEYIQIDSLYQWNASAGSCFETFLKKELHSEKLHYQNSYETNHCKFTKYLFNDQGEIGLIWINLVNEDLFIVDTKGKLYNDLLKIYDVKKDDYFIVMNESFSYELSIESSLTQSNFLENYISKED